MLTNTKMSKPAPNCPAPPTLNDTRKKREEATDNADSKETANPKGLSQRQDPK